MGIKYLLAIDLETTGLDPQFNEIVEIGAVLLDNKFNELGSYECLVQPEHPERALSYNDDWTIRDNLALFDKNELTRFGINIHQALYNLESFVRGQVRETKDVCLFGQNIKFDDGFLRAAYKQCERDWPFDYHAIDLVSIYYCYCLEHGCVPESLSIKDMLKGTGINNGCGHRAMADIKNAIALAQRMLHL